jgi:hypothetical protein
MNGQTIFSKKAISTASLQKTAYYVPPIPEWKALKSGKNSSVRMACILDDYIFEGMRFECTLLPLTTSNWKSVLKYGKPDFLLMNSFIESVTDDWNMSQLKIGETLLAEILSFAKSNRIPTVYWFTKDHQYHHLFWKLSSSFDLVFCADPKEVELLSVEGVQASLLLPCVQPALYNPFRHFEDYHSLSIELLVDGWASIDRHTKEFDYLSQLISSGSIKIIESNYVITKNRVEASSAFKYATLGYVSEKTKQAVMKYVDVYLGLTPNIQDETERMWSYLQVGACKVCVIHQGGSLRHTDFNRLVLHAETPENFVNYLKWFSLDPLMRDKYAHLAWREVNQRHTFAHRLKEICLKLGVGNDWNEHPKASLVFPTYREENIKRCIATFTRQLYQNKELILVYNSNKALSNDICREINNVIDSSLLKLPGNCFAGDCINYGALSASGEYLFRVDDDDYYSEHYIQDRMLYHQAVDLDFIANPQTLFFYFTDDNLVYLRKHNSKPHSLSSNSSYSIKFAGNSYSGKLDIFKKSPFRPNNYSAADVFFLDNLPNNTSMASADIMNMAAERREDQSTHTWRIRSHDVLKKSSALFSHYKCVSC